MWRQLILVERPSMARSTPDLTGDRPRGAAEDAEVVSKVRYEATNNVHVEKGPISLVLVRLLVSHRIPMPEARSGLCRGAAAIVRKLMRELYIAFQIW